MWIRKTQKAHDLSSQAAHTKWIRPPSGASTISTKAGEREHAGKARPRRTSEAVAYTKRITCIPHRELQGLVEILPTPTQTQQLTKMLWDCAIWLHKEVCRHLDIWFALFLAFTPCFHKRGNTIKGRASAESEWPVWALKSLNLFSPSISKATKAKLPRNGNRQLVWRHWHHKWFHRLSPKLKTRTHTSWRTPSLTLLCLSHVWWE